MSISRRLRRGKGSTLQKAVSQTEQAVQALRQMEGLPSILEELQTQLGEIGALASALTEDHETLLAELEIQREVTIRLTAYVSFRGTVSEGMISEEDLRQAETMLRETIEKERESRAKVDPA